MAHPSWHNHAACQHTDPEIFFEPDLEAVAQNICGRCIVKDDCLNWAISKPEKFGVWGGLTESQRKKTNVKRPRVKCPGCGSTAVTALPNRHEACESCGLSWHI